MSDVFSSIIDAIAEQETEKMDRYSAMESARTKVCYSERAERNANANIWREYRLSGRTDGKLN